MAKAAKGESVSGVFKQIIAENPKLKKRGGNAEILRLFSERTGEEIANRHKQILANVKSSLKRRKRGRKKKAAEAAAGVPAKVKKVRASGNALERLEIHIDNCLVEARAIGNSDLDKVISSLRSARNHVVLMQG